MDGRAVEEGGTPVKHWESAAPFFFKQDGRVVFFGVRRMSQAGLWPREQSRPTDSQAEQRVYDALSRTLLKGWTAWHSLRVRTEHGFEGEGDFVLAIPGRGFLVLEVKGGSLEMRDGRWFQNGHPLDKAPREQAHGFAKTLLSRLKELGSFSVPFGILTIFPDTSFSFTPDQDDLRGLILGGQDLPWLGEAISAKLEQAFPEGFVVPSQNWTGMLHNLWGETWFPRLKLGQLAKVGADQRLRLDQEQLRLIDALASNDRLLVQGTAGSGKTIIAREAALRMAEAGVRVLYLCFTDALAQWVGAELALPNIQVATVPRYAVQLLQRAGKVEVPPDSADFWLYVSLRAATEALPVGEECPDVVILDEAQDLTAGDWFLVEELCKGRKAWIFHDPAQSFWDDRSLPDWAGAGGRFCLNKYYRCPPAIMEFSKAVHRQDFDQQIVDDGVRSGVLSIVGAPSRSAVLGKIENEIQRLRSEGFAPGDICVLSLRGQKAEDGIGRLQRIGGVPVVRAHDPAMTSNVVADTFLRFKGLERPAVIVTDLRLVTNRADVRMHIALTRALDVVRVVGAKEDLVDLPNLRLQ